MTLLNVVKAPSTFSFETCSLAATSLLNSFVDNCDYDEALYDYLAFCYDRENCSIVNMAQTLMKKVFQVTTVFNDLVAAFVEGVPGPTDTKDKVETFADKIGQNLGKLLRYATEFDYSLIGVN